MSFEAFHRWQWCVLGALAGMLVGWGQILSEGQGPAGGPGFISLAEFQRDLRLPAVMGKPHLTSLVIHPGKRIDVVSLQRLMPETLQYEEIRLAAPRPFQPLASAGVMAGSYASVSDYLAEAYPGVSLRRAWWEALGARVTIDAAVGMLLVGGIWPSILQFLVGAGLGRKPTEPEYDLSRFQGGPEPKGKRAEASAEDEATLGELEEEMLRNLAASAGPGGVSASPAQAPAPVAALQSAPDEPIHIGEEAGPKDYRGEFYPVARTPGAERDESGFTLVEVLVVMGIIAVLISLLMPTLVTVRKNSEQVKCASNLRQLGLALNLYANANHGWLPDWSGWQTYPDGQSAEDSPGLGWTEKLQPYFVAPNSPLYNCPAFPSREKRINYFLAAKWSGMQGLHAMKLTDVKMTSRFVLSGDKTQRGLYPPSFGTNEHTTDDCDPDDFGDGLPVLAWPWDPGGSYMHPNGNNVLFDDGHVMLCGRYDRSTMTFHPRKMLDWSEVTKDGGSEPSPTSNP